MSASMDRWCLLTALRGTVLGLLLMFAPVSVSVTSLLVCLRVMLFVGTMLFLSLIFFPPSRQLVWLTLPPEARGIEKRGLEWLVLRASQAHLVKTSRLRQHRMAYNRPAWFCVWRQKCRSGVLSPCAVPSLTVHVQD